MMMELKHFRIKKEGVGNLVTCMIAIVIFMAVMGYSVVTYTNLNLAIKKGRIERSVLLQMETEGYLSAAARDEITKQLADLGVEGISFAGTTMTPAGYGNTVILSVTGTIRTKNIIGLKNLSEFLRGSDTNEFKIYQKSTAKY